jgi:hypothetical protein
LSEAPTNRRQVLSTVGVFALLIAVTFLLRIFYARNLYQDDGLWFTSAQELIRGKTLYREIYFDKPPVLPLVYAALFKLAGVHILTIRLFTMLYSVLISALLYGLATRLYGRREGLLAAAMFTVFSTTFTTGHMQGLNTDFLMVLPYTAAAFCFLQSISPIFGKAKAVRSRLWYAMAAGVCVAIGVQTNPKALFDLLFFAAALVVSSRWIHQSSSLEGPGCSPGGSARPGVGILAATIIGSILATLPFLIMIGRANALGDYWFDVWYWGARYARYYSLSSALSSAFSQTFQYFGLNPLLLFGVGFALIGTWRVRETMSHAGGEAYPPRADLILLIWFAASYAGLATGGRFFGHYFFQLLPSLCVLSARGVTGVLTLSKEGRPRLRRFVLAGLCAATLLPIVRFHGRTVSIAIDSVRGVEPSGEWLHARLNLEEKEAAEAVTRPDPHGLPADIQNEGSGPASWLFVWGYRPEIYFWSQLRPASKFLSSQSLTGVPADVHYFADGYKPLLSTNETAQQRAQLVSELSATRPKYIIDELEFFNSALAMKTYPDLQEIMSRYRRVGVVGRFVLYIRRDMTRRYLKRHPAGPSQ